MVVSSSQHLEGDVRKMVNRGLPGLHSKFKDSLNYRVKPYLKKT